MIVYADDVTIFVTSQHDILKIQDAIDNYAAASGARINITKSMATAAGTWDTSINVLNIPYYTEMKILGIHLTNTVHQSAKNSWATLTGKIRTQARDT